MTEERTWLEENSSQQVFVCMVAWAELCGQYNVICLFVILLIIKLTLVHLSCQGNCFLFTLMYSRWWSATRATVLFFKLQSSSYSLGVTLGLLVFSKWLWFCSIMFDLRKFLMFAYTVYPLTDWLTAGNDKLIFLFFSLLSVWAEGSVEEQVGCQKSQLAGRLWGICRYIQHWPRLLTLAARSWMGAHLCGRRMTGIVWFGKNIALHETLFQHPWHVFSHV